MKANLLSLSPPAAHTASGFDLHTCFPALPTLQSTLVTLLQMNSEFSSLRQQQNEALPHPACQTQSCVPEGPCHLFLQVNDKLLRTLLEKGETGRRTRKGGGKDKLNFTDIFNTLW